MKKIAIVFGVLLLLCLVACGKNGTVCTHISTTWIVEKAPSCSAEGSQYKQCNDCKKTLETEAIAKLAHTVSDWVEEPADTCDSEGSKYKKCIVCGAKVEEATIAKKDHISSDWIEDVVASCSTEGSRHKECTVCKAVLETESLPKLSHKDSEWVLAQETSCAAAGRREKQCPVCGEVIATQEIKQLEHTPGEWVVTAQANCTTTGCKELRCTVCTQVIDTETLPFAHIPGEDDGNCLTPVQCTVCSAMAIEAMGSHIYFDLDDATCNNPGCDWSRILIDESQILLKDSFSTGILDADKWAYNDVTTDVNAYSAEVNEAHQLEINTTQGDSAITLGGKFASTSGTLTVEMLFCADFNKSSGSSPGLALLNVRQGTSIKVTIQAFENAIAVRSWDPIKKQQFTNSYTQFPIESGRTYHLKVVMDTDTDTLDIYLDGEWILSGLPFRENADALDNIVFGVLGKSTDLTATYDDIIVYKNEE